MSLSAPLSATRERLKSWLTERALPLWWEPGADLERGGFHDRLDVAGRPLPGPRRCRVQARQVFSYAEAGALGWRGPWREAMNHASSALARDFVRADGLCRTHAGQGPDAVDLYDQAFVLLAGASLARAGDADAEARALTLLDRLPRDPAGGFAGFDGELAANPNMHLFEAFLAWTAASPEGPWRAAAAGQARLALTRLIDPESGALGEAFGPGWTAPDAPGARRIEPGHQFEWAWLLMRWSLVSGDGAALAAALRLVELAERAGVADGVTINALDGALTAVNRGARLWPQTERLRAHLLAGVLTGDAAFDDMALAAAAGLQRFLDVPTPGSWRDSLTGGDLSAPASSLYHLVGAIAQLDRAAEGRP